VHIDGNATSTPLGHLFIDFRLSCSFSHKCQLLWLISRASVCVLAPLACLPALSRTFSVAFPRFGRAFSRFGRAFSLRLAFSRFGLAFPRFGHFSAFKPYCGFGYSRTMAAFNWNKREARRTF
jgi:hypothetical protein